MNTKQKGNVAERKSKRILQDQGYVVVKAGASLGAADLVACKAGESVLFVQVKSGGRSDFEGFGPTDRGALISEARRAGAVPVLHRWAPRARQPKIVPAGEWPGHQPASRPARNSASCTCRTEGCTCRA